MISEFFLQDKPTTQLELLIFAIVFTILCLCFLCWCLFLIVDIVCDRIETFIRV